MYKDTMAHTRRYKDFCKRGLETECTERGDSQIEGLCYTISHTPSPEVRFLIFSIFSIMVLFFTSTGKYTVFEKRNPH